MSEIELVSEHEKWIFQYLRLAYAASLVDDEKLKGFLASVETEEIFDNWMAAAELLDSNAELMAALLERVAALRLKKQ
jgi:hypothetical protein